MQSRRRLYQAIESGAADASDPTLKERIATVKAERDMRRPPSTARLADMWPEARLTEEETAAFVEVMRANVLGSDVSFRRAWLRAMIDNVKVDDTESCAAASPVSPTEFLLRSSTGFRLRATAGPRWSKSTLYRGTEVQHPPCG